MNLLFQKVMVRMFESQKVPEEKLDPIPDVELNIARDMAKRSWILFLPVAIGLGFLIGPEAGFAVVLAGVLIVGNLLLAAKICAAISPNAIMAGALSGFMMRLIIVFGVALLVRNVSLIDFKVWLLSVAIGHIALLAWETKYISFSLSHPGVKP